MSGSRILDGPALLRALTRAGLDYVVIGGLAVIAHGYERATRDIDIVPSPTVENFRRLLAVLDDLDYEMLGLDEFESEELVLPSLDALQNGGSWVLGTRLGRLDILQLIEPDMNYAKLSANAFEDEVFGCRVRFCSYEDLLAMKEAAGRPQDLADIERLRTIRSRD